MSYFRFIDDNSVETFYFEEGGVWDDCNKEELVKMMRGTTPNEAQALSRDPNYCNLVPYKTTHEAISEKYAKMDYDLKQFAEPTASDPGVDLNDALQTSEDIAQKIMSLDMGEKDFQCRFCSFTVWLNETINSEGVSYHLCCHYGKNNTKQHKEPEKPMEDPHDWSV